MKRNNLSLAVLAAVDQTTLASAIFTDLETMFEAINDLLPPGVARELAGIGKQMAQDHADTFAAQGEELLSAFNSIKG